MVSGKIKEGDMLLQVSKVNVTNCPRPVAAPTPAPPPPSPVQLHSPSLVWDTVGHLCLKVHFALSRPAS